MINTFLIVCLLACVSSFKVNAFAAKAIDYEGVKQVGGLETDTNGDLLVFHRGSRKWEIDSFIANDFTVFNTDKYGPIRENVLETIDPIRSSIVRSVGANTFYMPHGLHIDHQGFVWLTDVALHQVFKYSPNDFSEPLLTLGTRFQPGNDPNHFCKPTSIEVSKSNGDVFVGDGYCNQRIVQFDHRGRFVREFKDNENPLIVVHSIALIENLICAASREDGRIVCFDVESGKLIKIITDENMQTVYAVQYDPVNKVIQAATGENKGALANVLTFDATKKSFGKLLRILDTNQLNLSEVHDVAVSQDGSTVIVGQLNGEIDFIPAKPTFIA